MKLARISVCSLLAFIPLLTRPAMGASPGAAEFQDGLDLLGEGKYEQACPKFKDSLEKEFNTGRLFYLALCYHKLGRSASALREYRNYLEKYRDLAPAVQTKPETKKRFADAQKSSAQLEGLVPTLNLIVVGDVPAGMVVKLDGAVFPESQFNVEQMLDPQDHELSIEVPGHPPNVQTVTLKDGQAPVKLIVWQPPERPAAVPAHNEPPRGPSSTRTTFAPSATYPETDVSGRKLGMYLGAVIGAAGVATGMATGAVAWSKSSSCDNATKICTDAPAKANLDQAQKWATASTIGFGVGAAGLATAVLLYLTHGSDAADAKRNVQVGVVALNKNETMLGVGGRF